MTERPRIVRVDWLDAHGGARSGWKDLQKAIDTRPKPAVAVGMLIKETKDAVVVFPFIISGLDTKFSLDNADCDAELAIPKSWVKKITNLGRL